MRSWKMMGLVVLAGVSLVACCILSYLWWICFDKPGMTSFEETTVATIGVWFTGFVFFRSLQSLLCLFIENRRIDSAVFSRDIYGVRRIIPFHEIIKRLEGIKEI